MKIREYGVVTGLRPGRAQLTILTNPKGECEGEGDCGSCASKQPRKVIWEIETGELALELGRKVLVEVEPPSVYYGVLFLLAIPLAVFFGVLLAAYSVAGEHPDLYAWKSGFAVLCACLATVLSYGLAAVVDRRLRSSERYRPIILKVEEPCSEKDREKVHTSSIERLPPPKMQSVPWVDT